MAVFSVVQKLKDLGPDLPSPHMKSLKGEANLFELRPKQGTCETRPIYARFGDRFTVLAVAAKTKDFDRAARCGAYDRKPALVTARAQRRGAIAHDDVSVMAASSV